MSLKILAVLEQRDSKLKKSSFEVISKAAELASLSGGSFEAVVAASSVEDAAKAGEYGAAKVTVLSNSAFALPCSSGYAKAVADYAKASGANVLLLSNTAMGKDIAPRIAVKLDAGIMVDAVALGYEGGDLIVTRPVFAGKALQEIKLTSEVKVITLRPNVFKAKVSSPGASAEVLSSAVDSPDLKERVTEIKKSEGKLDVAEADIIVSGGRGLKEAGNFNLVEDLADALGAAVGASRAVVDAGWRPHGEQVGQTGKTVSPSLYVACGISGAIQHLAGMSSSKYIVAINKDKDAPIFQVADYGIVGDVFEVLPALTAEIKKIKS